MALSSYSISCLPNISRREMKFERNYNALLRFFIWGMYEKLYQLTYERGGQDKAAFLHFPTNTNTYFQVSHSLIMFLCNVLLAIEEISLPIENPFIYSKNKYSIFLCKCIGSKLVMVVMFQRLFEVYINSDGYNREISHLTDRNR